MGWHAASSSPINQFIANSSNICILLGEQLAEDRA
jgi:hypothetical protein